MKTTVAICSMLVSALAFAAGDGKKLPVWKQEPTAVLGIQLGKPLEASNIPTCLESMEISPEVCVKKPYKLETGLVYRMLGHPFDYARMTLTVDETGVVSYIGATMDHDRFSDFVKALVIKYGQPTVKGDVPVQSKAGATFSNMMYVWSGKAITIRAVERSGRVDESFVSFSDNASNTRTEVKQKQADKAAASKL